MDYLLYLALGAVAGLISGLFGLGAMANILYRAPDAARLCRAIQTQLNDTSGCSLIAPDLCALRVLAQDGYALRQIILPILDRLTQNTLPKCWRL